MTSISKKKIALIEKYNQEKLRNKAMKNGCNFEVTRNCFFCLTIQNLEKMLLLIHML